jgi:hypothetical protein
MVCPAPSHVSVRFADQRTEAYPSSCPGSEEAEYYSAQSSPCTVNRSGDRGDQCQRCQDEDDLDPLAPKVGFVRVSCLKGQQVNGLHYQTRRPI